MNRAYAWKQNGHISLWRYTQNERNYPGWHLAADDKGYRSLFELLEALASDAKGTRTIHLVTPSQSQLLIPNNQGGLATWVSPTRLRVAHSDSPTDWFFPPDLEPASLKLGLDWSHSMRQGIAWVPSNRGDYSIGTRECGNFRLWLW